MKKVLINSTGVSLIELMVALSIGAVLVLVTAEYQKTKLIRGMNQSRGVQAGSLMREFLEARKKVFACAQGDVTFLNASTQNNITSFELASTNKAGTYFTEKVVHECVAAPAGMNGVNIKTISDSDLNTIKTCTGITTCGFPITGTGELREIPRIQIQRRLTSDNTVLSTQTFPLVTGNGTDGNPIGAVLCGRANGTLTNTGAAGEYRDLNFDLYVLVRQTNNSIKLIRQQANIPRPKNFITGSSIRICP